MIIDTGTIVEIRVQTIIFLATCSKSPFELGNTFKSIFNHPLRIFPIKEVYRLMDQLGSCLVCVCQYMVEYSDALSLGPTLGLGIFV